MQVLKSRAGIQSKIIFGFLACLLPQCSPKNPYNQGYVSHKVKKQTQLNLITEKQAGKFNLPPDVNPKGGLTPEEAAAVALWSNAQFQADFVALKV
jgi:hypothetical protein